jgi:hypothetical protein
MNLSFHICLSTLLGNLKLFLAGPAAHFGELVVCPVQYVEANVAFLKALRPASPR